MMEDKTDAGVMIRLIHQAMLKHGVDVEDVFRRCGITPEYLARDQLRTPHEAQLYFWAVLEEVSGDPDIGLHLGVHLPVFKGQVLEYLFLSSPTFGEGLRRGLAYQRLLSDAANSTLEVRDGMACLVLYSANASVRRIRHFNECFCLGLLKFFHFVTEGAFRPEYIDFEHQAPDNCNEHERLFGCPVRFEQPENRVWFKAELLELPSPHAEPELLKLHEQLASQQMARLELQDIVSRVRRAIAELLESGEVSLEVVAQRLDMKPRTLRTRLNEANTNFNQVLAEFRCNLAKRLLAQTDESIDEIVYLTGFSEPSTFYRAFRRWVGMTPVEYRRQKKSEAEPEAGLSSKAANLS